MVDLQRSLRPNDTIPPLPVSELAARAAGRKKRKRVATSGLVLGCVGVAVLAFANLPRSSTNTATVADGTEITAVDRPAPEATTEPTTAESSATESPAGDQQDSAPPTAETEAVDEPTPTVTAVPPSTDSADQAELDNYGLDGSGPAPSTTPGITTETTTTSSWEDGYCMQVTVINEGDKPVTWQVVLHLGGDIAELWNAAATSYEGDLDGDLVVFSGKADYNTALQAGETTSFGTCVDS